MFPNGSSEGLYHTADASLWFFHAVDRYVAADAGRARSSRSCRRCARSQTTICEGTRFGIRIDPATAC
jgi:hypothetical protein